MLSFFMMQNRANCSLVSDSNYQRLEYCPEINQQFLEFSNYLFNYTNSHFEFRTTRFEAGVSRFEAGVSRFEAGVSRFEAGVSRFEAGSNRFEAGSSRFEAGSLGSDSRFHHFKPNNTQFNLNHITNQFTINQFEFSIN